MKQDLLLLLACPHCYGRLILQDRSLGGPIRPRRDEMHPADWPARSAHNAVGASNPSGAMPRRMTQPAPVAEIEERVGPTQALHSPEIVEGILRCDGCQATYPVVKGVPRFVPSDGYTSSFSFEWNRFRTTQLDSVSRRRESEFRFQQSLDRPLPELEGKRILDAGCGMGRFAEVALKYGATVVGMDLSLAVDSAYDNLGRHPKAHFVQADLFAPPFQPESFDFIYSLGVLHHTPDPRRAFLGLVRFAKREGKISVTLYSGYNKVYVASTNFWRRFLTKVPHPILYQLSHLAIPYYYLCRIPFFGLGFQAVFPISMHPVAEWRVLDTLDCYSPTYQSYHTHYEVGRWFNEAGLRHIEILKPGISFVGTRD